MKAIVWTKYGSPDGLQLREVEKPVPKDNEVLIKVHAATVTAGDCEVRSLKLPLLLALPIRLYAGLLRPTRITILGQEMAGQIEAVGKDVTLFKEGDHVHGNTGLRFGAYAEYLCLPEKGTLAKKPANSSFEEAAAVPTGGLEALHFMQTANIKNGHKVLINGAGGSIGTFAVQLAKLFGAEVTGVDSTDKLELLRSIGAAHVIDYTQQDFTANGQTYDVIFDVIGKSSFADSLRSLKPGGCYLIGNASVSQRMRARRASQKTSKRVIVEPAPMKADDLIFLDELIEARKIKPIIGRRFPLEQTAEAHHYVESGGKKGNVVIMVEHSD